MDKEVVKRFQEKILNSKEFLNSDTNKRLLTYLIESTLNNENPKEYTIAIDVFNSKQGNPNDANVRAYISKLRKKLDFYYKNEGVKDSIWFSIPRGSYSIVFSANKGVSKITKKVYWRVMEVLTIAIVVWGIVLLTQKESNIKRLKNTELWGELITNKLKTTIVAGDFFVFADKNLTGKDGEHYTLRLSNVNSQEELREYVDANDSMNIEDVSYLKGVSFLQRDALFSMPYIIPLLDRNSVNYDIVLGTNFSWELFNNNNIIYSGVFKNMKSLSFLSQKLNVDYYLDEERLDYQMPDTLLSFYPYSDDFYYTDYVLVSKIPGPQNNVIHFFVSVFDIGCIEAVKYFTQTDFVNSFNKQTLDGTKYFSALFKVEGVERSAVSFNMVAYQGIQDSTLNFFWNNKVQ